MEFVGSFKYTNKLIVVIWCVCSAQRQFFTQGVKLQRLWVVVVCDCTQKVSADPEKSQRKRRQALLVVGVHIPAQFQPGINDLVSSFQTAPCVELDASLLESTPCRVPSLFLSCHSFCRHSSLPGENVWDSPVLKHAL